MSMNKTIPFALALLACSISANAQTITDPQIAAIVVTANQVDVDAGKLAGVGAHSYTAGNATAGSDEAARFKKG